MKQYCIICSVVKLRALKLTSMRKYLIFFFCLALLLVDNKSKAQDPQFSQYYAAPLYLNPALTGINQMGRAGINYRNQWPSIEASFETFSAYIDYNFDEKNSSLGMIITRDTEGLVGLSSTEIGLQYAYQVNLNYKWIFRPAFQVSYTLRDLNFDKLTFGDQFDNTGLVRPISAEQFASGSQVGYVDLALGGLWYSKDMWIGVAAHHIREPNQSFVDGDSPLPRKVSVHGGYRIPLKSGFRRKGSTTSGAERTLSPTFNYRSQGNFDQLDLGTYFTMAPVIFGVWYRGIPLKSPEGGGSNTESVIFMMGLTKNKVTMGYSFDYTLSKLGIGSGGAHEVSITYTFKAGSPRKPSREVRELRCPVPFIF